MIFLILILGLILGSFLGAYSYRAPMNLQIAKGRSFCPKCKSQISWYDNIPLISYLLLGGKCRNCHKPIGIREPLIEITTGTLFVFVYLAFSNCFQSIYASPLCLTSSYFGPFALPVLLFITSVFIVVFITDFEHQVILDKAIFFLFSIMAMLFVFFVPDKIYEHLFAGLLVALFYLFLHLVTLGKGMGLGDVKLALLGGLILGPGFNFIWVLVSFVTGAAVGLVLIAAKKAKFGKHIAFGPFMVVSFFVTFFAGNYIQSILFPFY